jgi:proteasome lid subunit RPN8/RPN11
MSGKGIQVKVKPQPVVVMEAEVARKIRQHSRSSMKAEVCGVLIGGNDQERTMIEACIPGVNAAQGGAHVTFTQDTWEHIYKIKDQQFPDDKIVGWYHSHPGFGVFLSEHDLFIQENFFSSPQQVAWVYDPHTDEEGCFGWVGGKIEKLSGVRFGYTKGVEASVATADDLDELDEESAGVDSRVPGRSGRERREPNWLIWTIWTVTCLAALAVGFVGGYIFLERRIGPLLDAYQQTLRQIAADPVGACEQLLQRPLRDPQVLPPASIAPRTPPAQPARQPDQAPPPKGNNGKH